MYVDECQEILPKVVAEVKKSIREKALEPHRNGQKVPFRTKSKRPVAPGAPPRTP